MKPLKLTIEGLHSFKEKQEIDFSKVCDTGLFGIFGNTGSGKSTILDAITLALYGAVFRAPNRTLGILNSQKDKLEVSFAFAIGLGTNRKTYRAERVFKRNKDKRDSVNTGACRLIEFHNAGEQVIAEGSGEVTKKIEEIIGLNMEDFTRSVVLPQGEFAKFLQLKDAERVRMLERIFSLYKYGVNLNEKAKKERDKLEIELGLVERSIQEQGNITAEVIIETQQELARKESEKDDLVSRAQLIEKEYDTANGIWQLQNELAQVRQEEIKHLLAQPDIDLQKNILQKSEAAEAVNPYFENRQKAETAFRAAQNELAGVLEVYRQEEEKNQKLKALFLQVDEEQRARQPELIEKRTRLQTVLSIADELSRKEADQKNFLLEQTKVAQLYDRAQQKLMKIEAEKSSLETKRNSLEEEIRSLTVTAEIKGRIITGVECEREFRRLAEESGKIQVELENETKTKVSLEAALKTQEAGKTLLIEKLTEAQSGEERLKLAKPGDLESYEIKSKALHQLEIDLQSMNTLAEGLKSEQADLLQLTEKQKSMETLYQQYTGEMDRCLLKTKGLEIAKKALLDEVKRLEELDLAARLAEGLAEGHSCPVCGSTVHPDVAKHCDLNEMESQKTEIKGLDEALGLERQNFDRLNRELAKYQTFIQQHQEQSLRTQTKINEKLAGLAENKKNLLPELREKSPMELTTHLQVEKKSLAEYRQAIIVWNDSCEKSRNTVARFKDEQASLEKQINDLSGQLAGLQKAINKLTAALEEMKPSLLERQRQYITLQTEMNLVDFQAESARIQVNERKIETFRADIEAISQELLMRDQSIKEAKEQKENYGLQLKEVETSLTGLAGEIGERRGKIMEVAGDRIPQELISEIESILAGLAKGLQEAKEKFESSSELLQKCLHQKAETQKQAALFETEVEKTRQILIQKLRERSFTSLNEFRESLRTDQERTELRKAINGYEDKCKNFQTQIETIFRKLSGQSISPEQWEQIQNAKKEVAARKEQITELIVQMNTSLADMAGRWQKIKEYQEQRQSLAAKKAMADEICKLLQGDAFVAYIAEEHMRYISRDASGRLEMLTNGRYALKMDDNKDFIISDNTNGGLARPVSSLSGGETFLVSLSLALALSSKIQLNSKNPLEFFFLDEGFGTLDSQLLELVMDSLEKLRHGNLTIGVISHVPELKNRIARRIIVTPAGVSGDGSRVRIEKA